MRNKLLFSRHCGIESEQAAWERWQRGALRIAHAQRSRAVFYYLERASAFLETDAWEAYCEDRTPRSWCASVAFARRSSQ